MALILQVVQFQLSLGLMLTECKLLCIFFKYIVLISLHVGCIKCTFVMMCYGSLI